MEPSSSAHCRGLTTPHHPHPNEAALEPESMSEQADASLVPPDFPRRGEGALSGVQPKLAVRLIDGKFVGGETAEELVVRYEACQDLATQLTEHAKRKWVEHAELPLREFLRRLRKGVVNKGWDIDARELDWVMLKVAVAMGGCLEDVLRQEPLLPVCGAEAPAHRYVETFVDRALSKLKR